MKKFLMIWLLLLFTFMTQLQGSEWGGWGHTPVTVGVSGASAVWTKSGNDIYYNLGNVGIGTTTPNHKLEVLGGAVSLGNGQYYRGKDTGGTSRSILGLEIDNIVKLGAQGASIPLQLFGGSASSFIYLASSGNFGIGTTTPDELLEVENLTGNTTVSVIADAAGVSRINLSDENDKNIHGVVAYQVGDSMEFVVNNSPRMTILSDGNVGIGTSNPGKKLDVAGGAVFNSGNANANFEVRTFAGVTLKIDGGSSNVGIKTTNFDGSAVGVLAIANGTAPAAGTANQAYIYAKDVTASSEMHVMDEAGNETLISPHDPNTGEWVFYSKNVNTGRILEIKMEELIFDLAEMMSQKTGKKYVYESEPLKSK